jgi:hypothetical protein
MAEFLWGVNPTQVDTVAQFTLGTECRDPRTRDFPQNVLRYVKSNAAIGLNAALTKDLTDETNEPHAVLATTATGQPLEGIAHVAIASGLFGWVTIKGKATNSITAAVTAGALLGSTATAGRLSTVATSGAETVAAQSQCRISTIDSSAGSGLVDVVINM